MLMCSYIMHFTNSFVRVQFIYSTFNSVSYYFVNKRPDNVCTCKVYVYTLMYVRTYVYVMFHCII